MICGAEHPARRREGEDTNMGDADVVITGIGMVTPLGRTAAETAEAWRAGCEAPRQRLPELHGTPLADVEVATLPELEPAERLSGRKMLKYMSAAAILGSLAASEAAGDAGIGGRFEPSQVGLFAATGLASARPEDFRAAIEASADSSGRFSCRLFGERGLPSTNPLLSFRLLANMPPCIISVMEGVGGPNYIFTPWEGQTGAALVEAWRAVAAGEVEAALTGAADTPAEPSALVFLRQAGILGEDEFPASGAAYLVLERAEQARRAGRRIHARIADMRLVAGGNTADPLAHRLGRTFAAAPAILMALSALSIANRTPRISEGTIGGLDGQGFRFALEGHR